VNEMRPGETLVQYRIRMLEEKHSKLERKYEKLEDTVTSIEIIQRGLVNSAALKVQQASAFRVTLTAGLIIAAATGAIAVIIAVVNAYLHYTQGTGVPTP